MKVDKQDITRLHQRIDSLQTDTFDKLDEHQDCLTDIKISVATISEQIKHFPTGRPCEQLKEHLNNHRDTAKTWKNGGINLVWKLIEVAAIVLGGIVLGSRLWD